MTSRRAFLKGSGALVIGWALGPRLALAQERPVALPGSLDTNRLLDAWLSIAPNGTVTIFTGKIELGQGIATALSQIAGDELDVEPTRIEGPWGEGLGYYAAGFAQPVLRVHAVYHRDDPIILGDPTLRFKDRGLAAGFAQTARRWHMPRRRARAGRCR